MNYATKDMLNSYLRDKNIFNIMAGRGRDLKNFFSLAERSGELPTILDEFANGKSMGDDHIRFGENYIFSKEGGVPVRYADLRQVYERVTKSYGTVTADYLIGITCDGQTHILCNCMYFTKDEVKQQIGIMMGYMQQKNPNIYFGYQ